MAPKKCFLGTLFGRNWLRKNCSDRLLPFKIICSTFFDLKQEFNYHERYETELSKLQQLEVAEPYSQLYLIAEPHVIPQIVVVLSVCNLFTFQITAKTILCCPSAGLLFHFNRYFKFYFFGRLTILFFIAKLFTNFCARS